MKLSDTFTRVSAYLADRYGRYEQSGLQQPRLDDAQRHWIEVWGASYPKDA